MPGGAARPLVAFPRVGALKSLAKANRMPADLALVSLAKWPVASMRGSSRQSDVRLEV
jgi:hypothetical protein